MHFQNNVVELIKTSKILNKIDAIDTLTCDTQNKLKIAVVTYQLGNTARKNY